MACWRHLKLSSLSVGQPSPQLLIKPDFGLKKYTVFLTDLSNIWSEELDLAGIVKRASQEDSPIEVSKQDTTQLTILLDNVKKSLTGADDTICRITRNSVNGIVLHTWTSLPAPLDSLRWKFCLQKRPPATLKNELILPLLVSSHVQHERVDSLITSITEKDREITRLLDQYESSNLDLASAFPSISGSKPGRRLVKREHAARHIPALAPFQEDAWRKDTARLNDAHISTLGLFQEALSDCALRVPLRLMSESEDQSWLTKVSESLDDLEPIMKSKQIHPSPKSKPTSNPPPEPSDEDTEDEFEMHGNFHVRESPHRKPEQLTKNDSTREKRLKIEVGEDESTDDDDLDAPSKKPSQIRSPPQETPEVDGPTEGGVSPSPRISVPAAQKPKGFKIGGAKAKKQAVVAPAPEALVKMRDLEGDRNIDDAQIPTHSKADSTTTSAGSKGPKKSFKIGGRHKDSKSSMPTVNLRGGASNGMRPTDMVEGPPEPGLPTSMRFSEAPAVARVEGQTNSPVQEEHEETLEEKVERKRRELKRKNEELAKKQMQKKKKRF
ncbi:XLF-domain-containing protein [Lindgomyces ingoldianus]|uniref:XLF-domain-containing protein n=1 Tax=Lindgomyces ingoldianus TaxID=673940 RepID=A0ACB6QQ67_9PLEO|nr:XLF-domain-containing protein [Lindgomyces ingoldianus]KAF2469134.1 XLF-domain-containing protein [Lindgomyces ingoldianus]